jgi:predicted CopG family antitoxin
MAKYYTSLSNDTPDLIRVNVELTRTEMSKLRQLTDAKASDSFSEIVRKLIKQRASRSKVKVIKG